MTSDERLGEALDELEYEFDQLGEMTPCSTSGTTRTEMECDDDRTETDIYSRIGESSDNPEQKRRYCEYLELIKQIDAQNNIIDELKMQIMRLCDKQCKSRNDLKDIKQLRQCMEQENLKLHCMINKAMQLQNFGSHRRYGDLPMATTLDEDNMAPYCNCIPMQGSQLKGESSECQTESQSQVSSCQDARDEKNLRRLYKAVAKIKICDPEDKKLIQQIAAALTNNKKKKDKDSNKPRRESCSQSTPAPSSSCDPCSSYRAASSSSKPSKYPTKHNSKSGNGSRGSEGPCPESMEKLKQKIVTMQSAVNKLKQEICRREKEKRDESPCPCNDDCEAELQTQGCGAEEQDAFIMCGGKRNTKASELEKLKENYVHLMAEYKKKDFKMKELEKRLKGFCGSCDSGYRGKRGDGPDPEAELELLRSRVNELKEEQVEFKCIMKEQSQQLEEYRNKYLGAQQQVEEQCVALEKLNMNNKRIENQINTEVKEIRAKFQEKLNELLHFPKLLENEQLKLAQCCKDKKELQEKLVLICKELKTLKEQQTPPKDTTDHRSQLAKCQLDLEHAKDQLEQCTRQRDLLCEQLRVTRDDLDTLRSESAKIIARTKERAELTRQHQQQQIDRLEKELAQCRATACLSVNDREAVIREMQGQLNTLSYSFDAAQKQIKTLRNHIAYVSNEKCFPAKF